MLNTKVKVMSEMNQEDKEKAIKEQIEGSLTALNMGLKLAHEYGIDISIKVKRIRDNDDMFLAGMNIHLPAVEQHELLLVSGDVDKGDDKSDSA